MKTVTLSKLEIVEIEALQRQLDNFITYKNASIRYMNRNDNKFYDAILMIDILQKLFYSFRSKIEKTTKTTASLTLSVSEAVMILQVCNSALTMQDDYERFVMQKSSGLIHQQLMNIN